jgi:hypothetical protein
MNLESRLLRKGFVAMLTFVGGFSFMREHMIMHGTLVILNFLAFDTFISTII